MCIQSILPTNFQKNRKGDGIHPPPPLSLRYQKNCVVLRGFKMFLFFQQKNKEACAYREIIWYIFQRGGGGGVQQHQQPLLP